MCLLRVQVTDHGAGYDTNNPPALTCPSDGSGTVGSGQTFTVMVAGGAVLVPQRAGGASLIPSRAHGARMVPRVAGGAYLTGRCAGGAQLAAAGTDATGGITKVEIVAPGAGYINGEIFAVTGGGYAFRAQFFVLDGVVAQASASYYGQGYVVSPGGAGPSDPRVRLLYPGGGGLEQNGTVTSIQIARTGTGYRAGNVTVSCAQAAPMCTGAGFSATYSVGPQGEIETVTVLAHGAGYDWQLPPVVTPAAGGGSGALLIATVAGGAVVLPRQLLIVNNQPSVGGLTVSLSGAGLGLAGFSPSARVGASACDSTEWVADSAVAARAIPGAAGTRRVTVSAESAVGTRTGLVSHDEGTLVSASFNGATTGATSLSLIGFGLGVHCLSAALRTGGTVSEVSWWLSDTGLLARVNAGSNFASTRRVAITVGAVGGTETDAASFDASAVVAAEINGACTGSFSVTLLGVGFGSASDSAWVRAARTSCEATRWLSDTGATALMAAGSAAWTLAAILTSGMLTGTRTAAVTYNTALLAGGILSGGLGRPLGLNAPTTGAATVVISGSGLGLSDSTLAGRLGGTAGETTVWLSDTTTACQVSGGRAGGTYAAVISIVSASVAGTSSTSMTYGSAWLSLSRPANAPATWHSMASPFLMLVWLGSGLASSGPSPSVRGGNTACEITIWVSDSALFSRPAQGVGRSLRSTVTTAPGRGVRSVTTAASFDLPSVSAAAVAPNGPALGRSAMVLAGTGFGLVGQSPTVRIGGCDGGAAEACVCGGTACESSAWVSNTALACRPARGLLSARPAVATVGVEAGTRTSVFSFDLHIVSTLVHPNGPESGGAPMSLLGANFGWLDRSGQVRLGGSGCESTTWTSDSALLCLLPSGGGLGLGVAVTLGLVVESRAAAFSYDGAVLAAVATAANARGMGSSTVSLIGTDLVPMLSPALRLGYTACHSSVWVSGTSALCLAAPGGSGTQPVTVTVAVKARETSAAMSYDNPLTSSLRSSNVGPAVAVLVLGANLGGGLAAASAHMGVGLTVAERTIWASDSAAICVPGQTSAGGRTLGVLLTAGVLVGSATSLATHDAISVSATVAAPNGAALGLSSLVLAGTGFGFAGNSPAARVGGCYGLVGLCGGTACEVTLWDSNTALVCRLAHGLPGAQAVVVTAGVAKGTGTTLFSFDSAWGAPRFSNGPCSGGAPVSLIGTNFGWLDRTPRGRVGWSACEATEWVSDSLVLCQLARGGYNAGEVSIVLTSDIVLATLGSSFSYDLPSITGIASATGGGSGNGPTTGWSNVTILGSGFAGAYAGLEQGEAVLQARLQSACWHTAWASDSAVVCQLAYGVAWGPAGSSPDAVVTVAGRAGTATGLFTYNRPYVTRVEAASGPATGGPTATFYGSGFGVVDYTPQGYIGDEQCLWTMWVSDSTLACALPAGYGQAVGVYVAIGEDFGPPSTYAGTFSYDDAFVLTVGGVPAADHPFLATWLQAEVLVAATARDAPLVTWPDSALAGVPAALLGAPSLVLRAVNDLPAVQLVSTRGQAVLLSGPGVSADGVAPAAAVFDEGTVLGTKFTAVMVVRITRINGAGDQTLFSASPLAVADAGDDLFDFKITPWRGGGGVGYEYAVQTVVDANLAAGADRRMAADTLFHILAFVGTGTEMQVYKDGTVAPLVQVHHLEASEGPPPYVRPVPDGALDGALPLLNAVAFGAVAAGGNLTQLLDGEVAEMLFYGVALLPYDLDRLGGYLARKYSLPWRSTTAPRVDALTPSNGPAAGGYFVTVYGANFGNGSGRMRATVGGANCSYADRVVSGCNVYSTECTVFAVVQVPAGLSGYADIEIVADEVAGRGDEAFYYDRPRVVDVEPTAAPAAGGSTVTVLGFNFGPGPHASVLFGPATSGNAGSEGFAACSSTAYTSDTALECRGTPTRRTGTGRLIVAAGTERSVEVPGVTDFSFVLVPAHYQCPVGVPACRDCCLSTCQLAAVRQGTASGRTPAVCAATCLTYCGGSLRRSGPPQRLRLGPEPPTASTVSLRWSPPLDAGGAAVIRYEASYVTEAGPVLGVSTSNATTKLVIRGLPAETDIWDIKVHAVTAFGHGAPSESVTASTASPLPPSAPISLRVSPGRAACDIVQVCWRHPVDDGGSSVTGYIVAFETAGRTGTLSLDSSQLCAELVSTPGALTLDGISVAAVNSAGVGAASYPPLSVALQQCRAPVIVSVLADTTTLAGEATAPQGFEIDQGHAGEANYGIASSDKSWMEGGDGHMLGVHQADSWARTAAVTIRARSSNEAIVATSGVFVGGVGAHRFVVVTPAPDAVAGTTIVTLTLSATDSPSGVGALATSASFRVTVVAAWHDLWPTAAPATGGLLVTVAGGGFEVGAVDYVCGFAPDVTAVDAAASTSANNPLVEPRPAAGEGTGAGADAGAALAAGVVVSPGRLVCEVPAWSAPAAVVGFYVARNGCCLLCTD